MHRESPSRRYRRFWRADPRRDVDEELAFHLAMRAEEFRRAGMSDAEAEEATMQRFGDVKEIRSEVEDLAVKRHARRRRAWHLDAVRQDIRFALRTLAANPGYTIVVALTLALGIGANAAVFSVAEGVLLKPLPYKNAEQLVRVWAKNDKAGIPLFSVSPDDYRDWRDQNRSMTGMGAFERARDATLSTADQPQTVAITAVTPSVFALVGTPAALGRVLSGDDARRAAPAVAVIANALWTTTFGADPKILGRPITVDGKSYTVVGVMPARWSMPETDAAIWRPLQLDGIEAQRGNHYLRVLGRLKPGVALESALADLATITARADQQNPAAFAGWGVAITSVPERLIGTQFKRALFVLIGVVAVVLLIACANAANLQLARAAARDRELAVRAALGASRSRITLQLLTESVTISLFAGVLGLALAYGGVALLRALGDTSIPRLEDVQLDGLVLLFTAAISIASGILFGLIPALRASRADVGEVLKQGGRGPGMSSVASGIRGALVVAEISLSLVLLIGAGLLLRSFARLQAVDVGFDDRNLFVARMQLPQATYPTPQSATTYYAGALERAAATGGVQSAALVSSAPFAGPNPGTAFVTLDHPLAPGAQAPGADYRYVSAGYFRTMGVALRRGRDFTPADRDDAPLAVVISTTLAKKYWPDADPIGRQIRVADIEKGPVLTVVGVVDDVRNQSLETDAVYPMMYFSWYGSPQQSMTLVARVRDGAASAAPAALRGMLVSLDRRLPAPAITPMADLVRRMMATRRFALLLLGVFACTALALAVIGLYGVLSYLVRQRAHELGIRVALGAPRGKLLRLIVFGALRLTAVGVALGLVASYALTRFLTSLLFGVSPTDALTFVALSALLAGVAVVASLGPALRATRSDPMLALRGET